MGRRPARAGVSAARMNSMPHSASMPAIRWPCSATARTASPARSPALPTTALLGSVGDDGDGSSRHTSATAAFSRGGNRVGVTAGTGRANLPAWLTPNGSRTSAGDVNINDLTVFAQKNIGREGRVSIAGTMAKARLIPSGDVPPAWPTAGTARPSPLAAATAHSAPASSATSSTRPASQQWEGLGLGLTWRTPWSGQLTVGADNLVTRGKNPFSPSYDTEQDEGAIPYVRYEQDL